MWMPCVKHPPHAWRILGMPHRRTPIRCHDDNSSARPQHPVDLARTGVEFGEIFEHLDGKDGIKLGIAVRRRGDIPSAAFDPGEFGAARLRRGDLVGADVNRADPSGRSDKPGSLTCKIAAAATHLQYSFTSAKTKRFEHRTATDDKVVRLGYGLLQAGHVAGKRQRVHHASCLRRRYTLSAKPQTPKVKRLPVFQSIRRSGISARIWAMKFRPVQCIGITTSGASSFSSAIVCST